MLTPAEKAEADRGKKAGSKPRWPYPGGVRLFADGHFDYDGPAAIVKETTGSDSKCTDSESAIIIPDNDDDDDDDHDNTSHDSSCGHKRGTSPPASDVPLKKTKLVSSAQKSTTAIVSGLPQHTREQQKVQIVKKEQAPARVIPEVRVKLATPNATAPKVATGPPAHPSLTPGPAAVSTTPILSTGTTSSAEDDVFAPPPSSLGLGAVLPNATPTSSGTLSPNTIIDSSTITASSRTLTTTTPLFDGSSALDSFAALNPARAVPLASAVDEMELAFLNTPLERSTLSQASSFLHRDPQPSFHPISNQQPAPNHVMTLFQAFLQQQATGSPPQLASGSDQQHATGSTPQVPDQSALIAHLQQQLQQQAQQLGAYQAQGSGNQITGSNLSQQPPQLGGPGVAFPGHSFGGQGTYFGGGHQGF